MKTQDITVDFAVAIPIGHHVEAIQFKKKGTDKVLIGPWIKDLDTGIEYGMDFHYEDRNLVHFDKITVWPIDIREDLEIDKKIIGRITRCRILTMRISMDWLMQTRLQIEQDN
jgi:hypothetical protein